MSPLFQRTGHIPARLPHPLQESRDPTRAAWARPTRPGIPRHPAGASRPRTPPGRESPCLPHPQSPIPENQSVSGQNKDNGRKREQAALPRQPAPARAARAPVPRQPGSLCRCRPHGMRTPCGSRAGRVCVLSAVLRRDKLAAAAKVLLSRRTRPSVPSPLEPAAIMKISATSGLCKVQHRPPGT